MKRCPKCRRRSVRCLVSLYLDIPGDLMHQLSKTNLRKRGVQVMGAGWPTSTMFCSRGACGWFLRLDPRTETPQPKGNE